MNITANYHTHTARCHHASGSERQYIESAIKAGYTTLGFSDHAPWPFKNGFVSRCRMTVNELSEYFDTLTTLKYEYAEQIEIHIGLEAEYFPSLFHEFRSILADFPCEYLILGQHYITLEGDGNYIGRRFSDKHMLEKHTDETVAAIETGAYLYVAHPDIANFTGDEKFYYSQALRICRAAKAADMPLEINMLGMREPRWYPRGAFFEAAAETGNKLIIGVDAHSPKHFTDNSAKEAKSDCLEFAESFDLELVDKIL